MFIIPNLVLVMQFINIAHKINRFELYIYFKNDLRYFCM